MNLPKIELSALPDLGSLTGVFGSASSAVQPLASDDTIIDIMVFVYDVTHTVNALL